jgi:hypothetical protein
LNFELKKNALYNEAASIAKAGYFKAQSSFYCSHGVDICRGHAIEQGIFDDEY